MKRPSRSTKFRTRLNAFARQMGVQEGWAGLNSYGRLKVILMVELGCKFAFDPVYDEVCEYVEHFNQGGAEAILNDKRQIARHAMIIKLTRL